MFGMMSNITGGHNEREWPDLNQIYETSLSGFIATWECGNFLTSLFRTRPWKSHQRERFIRQMWHIMWCKIPEVTWTYDVKSGKWHGSVKWHIWRERHVNWKQAGRCELTKLTLMVTSHLQKIITCHNDAPKLAAWNIANQEPSRNDVSWVHQAYAFANLAARKMWLEMTIAISGRVGHIFECRYRWKHPAWTG
jgi:hypothetical protein